MAKQIDLEMMRGDTFSFDVVLHGVDPESIESVYFTVKKKPTDSDRDAVVQKSLGDGITRMDGDDLRYRVRVAPGDTDGVAAKVYVYDIQLGVGTDIFTPVTGRLDIRQDVTEVRI